MMFPNWVCPPLPAKQALGNKDPLFVAHRRWGLEQFLKHVVEHPDLRLTQPLQLFLESSCETMAQAKKTLQKEKDSTPGLWRRSKMAFSSLDKKYADPELEAQKAAVQTLQNALNRLVTYTGRLPPLTRQTSATQAEISANLTQFSETQDSSTAKMATHAANHYNRIGAITQDFALAEAQALHEVLNYQVGLLEACADVFDGRKTCAMTTQSYQSSVDSANAEYVKYKDNPSKASKAQKAHANYLEASEKLQTQQGLYEKYMSSLPVELARFEETRKKEFMHSMIQSAEVNLEYHQRMAEEWRAHVAQLKSEISTTL